MFVAISLLFLATAAGATEIAPYGALTLDRLSGPDEWSTGFEVGAEITEEPVALVASLTNHDILSESEAYPWSTTFRLGAGVYDSGHSILGVDVTPFGLVTLSRVSGPDQWSTGLSIGLKFDFKPIWLRLAHDRHDILTSDKSEAYSWDSTTSLAAGISFGKKEGGKKDG
jgi:hypothetical protein